MRTHHHAVTIHLAQSFLVNLSITAYHLIDTIGDVNRDSLTIGIENHDDIVPLIIGGMTIQSIGHSKCWRREEIQVTLHRISISHTESKMMLAQGNQFLIVVENLRITGLVLPVQAINAVGTLIGVMHALLGTQQFLATQHKGNTL